MCFVRENSIVVRIGIPREAQEVWNVAEIAGNQGEALSQEEVNVVSSPTFAEKLFVCVGSPVLATVFVTLFCHLDIGTDSWHTSSRSESLELKTIKQHTFLDIIKGEFLQKREVSGEGRNEEDYQDAWGERWEAKGQGLCSEGSSSFVSSLLTLAAGVGLSV